MNYVLEDDINGNSKSGALFKVWIIYKNFPIMTIYLESSKINHKITYVCFNILKKRAQFEFSKFGVSFKLYQK